jgi:PAS domain S-box-containing protein
MSATAGPARQGSRHYWGIRSQTLIAAGVVAAFCVLVLLAFGVIWRSGERIMEGARVRTQAMARVLNQHAVRSVDAVDMLLRAVAKELGPNPQDAIKRSSTTSLLAELTRNQPHVLAVRLLDGAGADQFDFTPGREISYGAEAEVPAAHRSLAEGALAVGRPFRDPVSRAWIVSISRRVTARDGIPGNIVVAHVALDFFQRFYDEVDVGDNGSIALFRSDGVILVRRPFGIGDVGRYFGDNELFREQIPRRAAGTYETTTSLDGVTRLVSYRRVDALPLVIAVTLAKSEVQAEWRGEALRDLGIALGAAATLMALGLMLVRLTRQRTETERVLHVTLDNMDQGLLMFDGSNTVQVCNRRATELLELPPDLLASKPRFRDIVAYQRAAGEFACADTMEGSAIPTQTEAPRNGVYERRRPDGRILEVRTVALPDGGAVRTFMDVTAHREAEAAAQADEARYRLLAENATDMIIQADLDTTRRYVSPACRELLGYAPEELVGTRPLDAVHPEDIERYRAILDNLTAGHTDLAVSRQRYRRKDGTFVWTEATFRLIRGEGGEPTGYVASGARHLRAAPARGAAQGAGPHGRAHGAVQPPRLRGAARRGVAAGAAHRQRVRSADAGCGLLQAVQRPLRARGGRRVPAAGGGPPAPGAAGDGLCGPDRGRGVRASPARDGACRRAHGRGGDPSAAGGGGDGPPQEPARGGDGEHRGGGVPAAGDPERGGPAQRLRPGHVRGQENRTKPRRQRRRAQRARAAGGGLKPCHRRPRPRTARRVPASWPPPCRGRVRPSLSVDSAAGPVVGIFISAPPRGMVRPCRRPRAPPRPSTGPESPIRSTSMPTTPMRRASACRRPRASAPSLKPCSRP